MRWLTTLFAREFPFETMLRVWDALLADPQRFMLAQCLATAMIDAKEEELAEKDFVECVQLLQNYEVTEVDRLLLQTNQIRMKELRRRRDALRLSQLPGGGT